MIKLKQILLLENPDTLEVSPYTSYHSENAFAFIYVIPFNHIYVAKKGGTSEYHAKFKYIFDDFKTDLEKLGIAEKYARNFYPNKIIEGRLFIKEKIISLWYYPKKEIFDKMIRALELKLKTSLQNWNIEVFKYYDNNIQHGDYEKDFYNDIELNIMSADIIKVSEYK